ncbi:30S ribosome-binding factor RbfA [Chlamydiifrater phoenicopteri]|uniref:30S ribosome-binding factor RbfA n=1 Tax=Chlamydiifrater phoenicopteri TaxID=2681469 RepID=UPI001BCC78B5|nr:30S ribosome-binding factor RbfA [Chlamydiifrater phoenicopteri]
MTESRRLKKANALLREAIAQVILREVQHPKISNEWITVTRVSVSPDMHTAKVYVSIMPNSKNGSEETLEALNSSSGFIACRASKGIVLKYFPELDFCLEDIFSPQDRVEELLWKIKEEEKTSPSSLDQTDEIL